jgi:hypothetical protein
MDGLHGNKKCRLLTLLAEKSANNERENLQEIDPCGFQLMQARDHGAIKQKKG